MIYRNANSLDPLALDQNLAGPKNVSRIHFEQPRCVQHDGRARWLLRVRDGPRTDQARTTAAKVRRQSELPMESLHGYDYAAVSPDLSMENFCGSVSPQYAPIPVRFCPRISV
jgi:hypothetical protein